MPAPIIPAIVAVVAAGSAIATKMKEEEDIEKAKRRGVELAAKEYAPILEDLEYQCKRIKQDRQRELNQIRSELTSNVTLYKRLKLEEEKLKKQVEIIKRQQKMNFKQMFGGAQGIAPMPDLWDDTSIWLMFYDKEKITKAQADAYIKAKITWEAKIKEIQDEILRIIEKLDANEQQLVEKNCTIKVEIAILQVNIRNLQTIIARS